MAIAMLISSDLNILKSTAWQFYRLIVVNRVVYLYLRLDVRLFLLLHWQAYLRLCVEAEI